MKQSSAIFSFLILMSLSYSILSGQKSITYTGYVYDSISNEPLIGVNIYTDDQKYGTSTDILGYYSVNLPESYDKITSSYLGFSPSTITLKKNEVNNFYLSQKYLPEVQIIANKKGRNNEIGKIEFNTTQLDKIPVLLGETDIIKALTLLPGVSSTVEGSSGLIVRGGNTSHNLILLDEVPIYNSAHLFGFIGTFNPQAIKHVELIKGGFPAYYGGRLSSVLNVNMKEGNQKKRNAELNVGLINSSLLFEGPLVEDKLSYMVAGRMSNFSLLLLPTRIAYNRQASSSFFNYWLYDINAKLTYKINDRQKLLFSYFKGNDFFSSTARDIVDVTSTNVSWGNNVYSLRYSNNLNSSLNLNVGLFFNHYDLNRNLLITQPLEKLSADLNNVSSISDFSLKPSLGIMHSSTNSSKIGVELSRRSISPFNYRFILSDGQGNEETQVETQDFTTFSGSVFLDHIYQPSLNWRFNVGLRYDAYQATTYEFRKLNPRFSVNYISAKLGTFKLSYDEMNQPLHLLSSNGAGLPTEVWVPATSQFPVEQSNQISLGYSKELSKLISYVSIEFYFKNIYNQIRANDLGIFLFDKDLNWENQLSSNGFSKAYGIEILAKQDFGKLTGWIGYTLSLGDSQFVGLNNGQSFTSDFQRLHDFEVTANYELSKKWSLSSNFVFQSGRPITFPSAITQDIFNTYSLVYSEINANKTKPYHRLDIGANKKWISKRGREVGFRFGAYNVYANNNPFYHQLFLNEDQEANTINYSVRQNSLLNFIPYVNYSIKF